MLVFQAKTIKNGTKYRVVWGKVCRGHGTNGVVRAKFRTNLPVSLLSRKSSTRCNVIVRLVLATARTVKTFHSCCHGREFQLTIHARGRAQLATEKQHPDTSILSKNETDANGCGEPVSLVKSSAGPRASRISLFSDMVAIRTKHGTPQIASSFPTR